MSKFTLFLNAALIGPAALAATVEPTPTQEALVNPGMGFVHYQYSGRLWAYGSQQEPGDTLDWFPGASVIYFRLNWAQLEPEEGRYRWDLIDSYAQPWIAKGRKIAIRVVCCENRFRWATPEWVHRAGAKGTFYRCDAPAVDWPSSNEDLWEPTYDDPVFLEKLRNFLRAFAARYDGDPSVAFVDVGTFGLWGEGHTCFTSKLSEAETTRQVKIHMDLWRKYLPRTYLVVSDDVAGPWSKDPDPEAMRYARSLGIGFRDDSIMCCTPPEYWFHDNWARAFAATTPVVVETGHFNLLTDKNDRWDEEAFVRSVVAYRASYMSIHGWPEKFLRRNRRAIERINRILGYRLELRKATFPDRVTVGEPVTIRSEWVNVGVAPCYAGATLCWTLLDAAGNVAWVSADAKSDARTLPPKADGAERPVAFGSVCTFGIRDTIPTLCDGVLVSARKELPGRFDDLKVPTLRPGTYTLAVSFGTPQGTPAIALPLAGGVARRYPLGKVTVAADGVQTPEAHAAEAPSAAFSLQAAEFAKYYAGITGAQPAPGLVTFAVDPGISKSGNDAYAIVSAGSRVRITGSNGRSVWYGLYDLLERRGGCRWFWDGDRVPKKREIDLSGLDVREEARFEYRGLRHFAHRGLTRFQAEHWSIADWRREIDWILKRRLNVFMPRIGMDDTWQKAYPDIVPYPDPAAPAEGGLRGYDNRVSFWGLEYRGRLRRAFTQYAFARGLMIPTDFGTMTHWYSRTPQAFLDRMKPPFLPVAKRIWSNYREPSGSVWDVFQPGWLDRYWRLTDAFVGAGYGSLDLLHTIGLGERNCYDDRAKNHRLKIDVLKMLIARARKEAPDAKILLAGWDFYSTWQPEEVRALLPELDPKNTVVWDYCGEAVRGQDAFQPTRDNDFTQWDVVGKFPYTFGIFLAYEHALDIRANYPVIEAREKIAAADPMCRGYVFWPESSHTDTFLLRYFTANAWRPGQKSADLLLPFCRDRYCAEHAERFASVWRKVIAISTICGWGGNWVRDLMEWPDGYREGRDLDRDAALLAENVPAILGELAEIEPRDAFEKRDAIDLARTAQDRDLIVRRHLLARAFGAWVAGTGNGAALAREIGDWTNRVAAAEATLSRHTDYSIRDSLARLEAAHHGVASDFGKVLVDNASNDYCRSHQYELVARRYRPLADAIAAEMLRRLASNDRRALDDAWLGAIRERYQDAPVDL